MKYTIYGEYHQRIETVKFATLKELAQYLVEQYEDIEDLCCIEDTDGFGYNAVDLVDEELEAAE
jgi:hypothetical protein